MAMPQRPHYTDDLAPFLGPPTKKIDTDPSDQFPHESWFLPDAYKGRNDYIRETIVQTVVNYNSFMTTFILPWKQQDNPNIAWDSIKFDKTLVEMEPEQGVPRYVTVEREAHTDYMVRRGLALMVNHGFAATPEGQRDFMHKVATIAGAVQETCDQSGVMALLRSKNMYGSYISDMVRNANDAYDMFQHELWKFGIIQHSQRGWYHMDAEAESILQTSNVEPDTWIVPARMRSYAAMGQHAETEVYRAGEKAARGNLERGKKNFSTFRGKNVYEIRPYTIDVDGRTIDPLNRTRMIGDFFVVPYFDLDKHGKALPRAGSTQVYCCETDRFERFSWTDMHQSFSTNEHAVKEAEGTFGTAGKTESESTNATQPHSLIMPNNEAGIRALVMVRMGDTASDAAITGVTKEAIDLLKDKDAGFFEIVRTTELAGDDETTKLAADVNKLYEIAVWQYHLKADRPVIDVPADVGRIHIATDVKDYIDQQSSIENWLMGVSESLIARCRTRFACCHSFKEIVAKIPEHQIPFETLAVALALLKQKENGIVCDWLCVRPFRQYTMGSGMLLKKGSELGNTFRGWADFQLTDNIIAKTHIGHFTFWHASVVTNPKCLFLAEDIFCTNYLSGEGKKCLDWQYNDEFNDDPMGTMNKYQASIICIPVPLGAMDPQSHRLNMNNPIDLSNDLRVHQERWGGNNIGVDVAMHSNRRPEYLMEAGFEKFIRHYVIGANDAGEFAERFWHFKSLNTQVDIDAAKTFETSGNLINTTCFHTMQKFRNPLNNRWEVTNLNTGHFGENGIYEGVKKIRCGFIDYFKEMDYQKSMAMGGMTI